MRRVRHKKKKFFYSVRYIDKNGIENQSNGFYVSQGYGDYKALKKTQRRISKKVKNWEVRYSKFQPNLSIQVIKAHRHCSLWNRELRLQ